MRETVARMNEAWSGFILSDKTTHRKFHTGDIDIRPMIINSSQSNCKTEYSQHIMELKLNFTVREFMNDISVLPPTVKHRYMKWTDRKL